MKKASLAFLFFLAACVGAFASDFFFYRTKDSDVPLSLRVVRVRDHRGAHVKDAKITISLTGKPKLEGRTDAAGMAQFPRLDVARVEAVRCEVPAIVGSSYVTSIVADARSIAWPVIFHLGPVRE